MDWVRMPTRPGWYMFTWALADWKQAFPVGVMQVCLPSGEVLVRRMIGPDAGPNHRTDCIRESDGYWHGPLEVPSPYASGEQPDHVTQPPRPSGR